MRNPILRQLSIGQRITVLFLAITAERDGYYGNATVIFDQCLQTSWLQEPLPNQVAKPRDLRTGKNYTAYRQRNTISPGHSRKNLMLEHLNQTYGHDKQLRFELHPSGLIQGHVETEACTGSFFLLGGHVADFQPRGEQPVLFLSSDSYFEVGKPIRGGVPICFPWFGAKQSDPKAPAHGTVRTALWEVLETALRDGILTVYLGLRVDAFELKYSMQFGRSLELQLQITNTSSHEQQCELALHTYFMLSDIKHVSIEGLESCAYRNQLTGEMLPASGAPIRFDSETDRVYQGSAEQISIHDEGLGRVVRIAPSGSNSTVVWNPWIDKSKRMPDFGDQEYHRMCCVETANVAAGAMHLAPGAISETSVTIAVARS